MSLTFGSGIPIAEIINTTTGDYKTVSVKLEEDDEDTESMINRLLDEKKSVQEIEAILASEFREVKAKKDEAVLFTPSEQSERVFIAGRSGMGKSTVAKKYIIQYKEMYPKNEIFLISRHQEDPVYDDVIKDIKHIVVCPDMLEPENKIELTDLKDSLVIFDDIDNLQDAKLSKYLHMLVDDLISNGRKYGIYVLYLGHQLSNYSKTRNIINEANKVIFFPGGSTYHIKQFLKTKAGLEFGKIEKIMGLQSRWVCLNFMRPYNVVHERGVFII